MLFASDLDNTLIHSYKVARAGDICVEHKDGKELSFMSPEAYALLKEVADDCLFVPVTTRSLEQYNRIDLGVRPRYAVVAHGALLVVDGKVDELWTCDTRRMFNGPLPIIDDCDLVFDIRYVDNFFIFGKSENPPRAVEYLSARLDTDKYSACAVHNKVYVFPVGLNKGLAISRLKKRLRIENVISAGDSVLDIPMLEAADFAIAPKTLELQGERVLKLEDELFAFKLLCAVRERVPKRL